MPDYDLLPFAREREIVVDAGYLGTGRHVIYGLVEVDVTRARALLAEHAAQQGEKLSFTAFIVASLGRAIATTPQVQAYRDWRRRLIVFHDVDVVIMIEPAPGAVAIPHIVRAAQRKSVLDVTREIRDVQDRPVSSPQRSRLTAMAPRLPRVARLLFFWGLKKNPHWFKQLSGTTVVTSVGMFGGRGGWGITFLPTHTLGITVGGLAQKPIVRNGEIATGEMLPLTLAFDHDVVDGAPAARFARRFCEMLEDATVLATIGAIE